jgi:hypothetical protein
MSWWHVSLGLEVLRSMRILRQGTISHDAARGAYMPSVTVLRDGSWIACQHVGESLASPDNRLEFLRARDDGVWEVRGVVHTADARWAYRGPDVEELSDGRLLMTATRFEVDGQQLFDPDSEALQRPEMVLFWSEDLGESWSEPDVVPVNLPPERYTWNKAGRLLMLSPSRWLFTFETWKPAGYDGPPDQKAAAVCSSDQGRTWGELTVIADDPSGDILWWDQMNTVLADGHVYVMLWTHRYGTKQDLPVHWVASDDSGRSWSPPRATNLPGQVCCPIPLPDGRVAAVYNHRGAPAGVRVAIADDLTSFDRDGEVVAFDAGAEATFGQTEHENFLAEHMLIAFGKPQGIYLERTGTLLVCFWCTVGGVTHTRWVEIEVS